MKPSRLFGRIAAFSVRRPRTVLAVTLVLVATATVAALGLPTSAGTNTLVDQNNSTYEATQRFKQKFGDDAVVVLAKGDLRRLVLTGNLGKLVALEGCLSGQAPPATQPEPCKQIAALDPSKVVYGPGTFLNQAVIQIENVLRGRIKSTNATAQSAGRRARRRAAAAGLPAAAQERAARVAAGRVTRVFEGGLVQIALRYGLTSVPSLDDPSFVNKVVFEQGKPAGRPKPRFAYLFPSSNAALISIRMRPDLSEAERDRAIDLYREAVARPEFALDGGSYVVSGVPVVVQSLAEKLRSEVFLLLAVAVLLMALVLIAMFVPPLRLLPLAIALSAAAITFGVLAALGGSLTMASIAVLPVLIGLSVDYAIQFQARWNEARAAGRPPAEAAAEAASSGGPVIATAVLATAAGFAVLALSPVPMVRTFGLLLVLGIAVAYALALTAGFAAIALASRPGSAPMPGSPTTRRLGERIELWRAHGGRRLSAAGTRSLAIAIASPGRVIAAGLLLAVCGWVAETHTPVISDLRDLAPPNLRAIKDVDELQKETGVSGELNVTVRSGDLTDPALIAWMRDFQTRVLARHGYTNGTRCADAELCPAISLNDLLGEASGASGSKQAKALINAIPPYFSQAAISRDPKTGGIGDTANIAFGIPVMPLDRQQALIDDIRAQIHPPGGPGPPDGAEVELAGLPVLAAQADSDLSSSRYWLPLAALLAVALMLTIAYRSLRRALIPLVPIVLATGWSALIVSAIGIPLNPLSATLGALVIAITTEFSVILSARYEREREAGRSVGEALRATYTRTGSAVLASGVTATAGFAVLAASDIRMLRDFGLVTVADLAVALAGVMLVLPAVLVWAERSRLAAAGRPRRRKLGLARRGAAPAADA